MAERTVEDRVFPVVCSCGCALLTQRVPGQSPQIVVWAYTLGDAAWVNHAAWDSTDAPAHDVYYMDARVNPPTLYVIRAHADEPSAPPPESQAALNTITFGPGDYRINLTIGSPVTIIGAPA
jgi:hypothetical protein